MNSDTIIVDLQSITTLQHHCTGCPPDALTCCAHYNICISLQDMRRAVGALPHAAVYCPQLKATDGYNNVFEKIADDLFQVDSTDDGLCVFAYRHNRTTRCSLHSAALDLGLPIALLKPEPCLLWPLALSETAPYTLSVHVDASAFACNHIRPRQKHIDPSMQDIICTVFGQRFAEEVSQALHGGRKSVEILR